MQSSRAPGAGPATPSSASLAGTPTRTPTDAQHEDDPRRAKILVTGLRRSGKTSVQQVVFGDVPPKDTFFLETTSRIVKTDIDSLVSLQLWDCPGNIPIAHLGVPLSHFATIIFVIDIQDDYHYPIAYLVGLIAAAVEVNPNVNFEVFVHKAEAMSDEFKLESLQQIHSRVSDELLDHPLSHMIGNFPVNFWLTSVYDHTIYEAFSRVIHRLIPQYPTLENLLNTLCASSGISKAFLFDVTCLLYVATDQSPVDNSSFELCCDYVQTLVNFSNLYKNLRPSSGPVHTHSPPSYHTPASSSPSNDSAASQPQASNPPQSPTEHTSASSPSHSLISTTKSHGVFGPNGALQRRSSAKSSNISAPTSAIERILTPEPDSRRWASSAAKLTPSSTLAYWQITDTLSLVALVRSTTYEKHRGLIEYNVTFVRDAVQRIVDLGLEKRNP